MIGLDSNLIIRYLVQDDPAQARQAAAVIEDRLGDDNHGFVSVVAMAEIAWVLERAYRFPHVVIAAAIERLLQIDLLDIENEREVFSAMIALKEGRGSFGDALIGALGSRAGCSCTLTFDKKALRIDGFELV